MKKEENVCSGTAWHEGLLYSEEGRERFPEERRERERGMERTYPTSPLSSSSTPSAPQTLPQPRSFSEVESKTPNLV